MARSRLSSFAVACVAVLSGGESSAATAVYTFTGGGSIPQAAGQPITSGWMTENRTSFPGLSPTTVLDNGATSIVPGNWLDTMGGGLAPFDATYSGSVTVTDGLVTAGTLSWTGEIGFEASGAPGTPGVGFYAIALTNGSYDLITGAYTGGFVCAANPGGLAPSACQGEVVTNFNLPLGTISFTDNEDGTVTLLLGSDDWTNNGGVKDIVAGDGTGSPDYDHRVTFRNLGVTVAPQAIVGTNGDDVLDGTAGNDTIQGLGGNDTIDGLAGADTMEGGSGNDTITVDNAGDLVVELAGGGSDTVRSSISYKLPSNTEKLVLLGTGNLNGTGNPAANTLTGNAGKNVLDGGSGADTMLGGQGNDTYKVDNAGDVVTELANEGVDTVRSNLSYTLPANVEHLTLATAGATNGTGNGLNNRITGFTSNNTLVGGGANDTLYGKQGNDTLTGGSGRDRFAFDTALGVNNVDNITDFSVANDFIILDDAIFTTLSVGTLPAAALRIGAAATTAAHRVIYNPANGLLSYDPDGTGAQPAVAFAAMTSGLAPTNANFTVN